MNQHNNWPRLLPLIVVMGAIFYQSHQPGNSFSLPDIVNIDKVLHCLVYAVLGLAFLFALPPRWRHERPVLAGCAVVLLCLVYGVTDEFHQSFIDGRCASTWDAAADGAGGLLAAGGWGYNHWRKKATT